MTDNDHPLAQIKNSKRLTANQPAPGGIIFLWISGNLCSKNLPVLDISDAFDPPHDYKEFFFKKGHFNKLGYKILAEKFFNLLTEKNFFRDVEFDYHMSPRLSQIWYTSAIRAGRRKFFRQRRTGGLQENSSRKESSNRGNRHELQYVHTGASTFGRIRGGKSCQVVYLRRGGG